ncbi:MAG: cytochrome c oxidase assembly protein [Planctomycetota bacterium]
MNPVLDACLRSWPWDPWLVFGLALTGLIYARGWRLLRRRDPSRWSLGHLAAFEGALVALFVALASPIEPFSSFFLQVHMLQHLLLMMVAPPLVWLGEPMMPLLRGLPRPLRMHVAAPLFRLAWLRTVCKTLVHPAPALIVFVAMTWLWHIPALYELALRSSDWHYLQHLCFLGSALLFWHPVIRPYPARPQWSAWWLIAILLLADVQNTILSALLTFSSRVLYAHYDAIPRLGGLTALDDQAAAGVLMWVPGSIAFLVPLFVIGLRLMFADGPRTVRTKTTGRIPLAVIGAPTSADALHLPLLGRFLKWRHARICMQVPLLLLAALVVVDGLQGPQVGAMNLAGVLPWIHWRGLLIFGLLALGNVFCMACPFVVPRTFARRLWPATRQWPRALRNKWLAVALLLAFLYAYEAFALWDSPWLTAWIVVAYFVAAFVVDSLFRGAAFCKYVCPIGQFNFIQSLVSPLEVRVRDLSVCAACQTKDCIRGRDTIPGCELDLHQPRKSSNMDCTFCLDCIHACPHDNIGIVPVMPGAELSRDPHRSGIGRFSQRADIAALIVVLTFGAFVNAALMTGPVVAWQDRMFVSWPSLVRVAILCLAGYVIVPACAVGLAASMNRLLLSGRILALATRGSYAFIPIGFGMWLSHYSFHFLTSYATALPALQRFLLERGGAWLGSPEWALSCCVPAAAWLLKLELVFLDVGLLGSLYLAYRIAWRDGGTFRRTLAIVMPWAVLIVFLFAAGVWIVFQPMEMRGALPG